jgi:hypothetical protein
VGPAALLLLLVQTDVRQAVARAVEALADPDRRLIAGAGRGDVRRQDPPATTSAAALRARALDEGEAVRFCAQFLADNQAADGLWAPGTPIDPLPPPERRRGAIHFDGCILAGPPYPVKARRAGPATGEAAVTLEAVEGLMACHLAGARFDPAILERAFKGWSAVERDPAETVLVLGILRDLQGREIRDDPDIAKAARRMATSPVPTAPRSLYVRLQAQLLYDGVLLGGQDWRDRGRRVLLASQEADGRWGDEAATLDAVLFLRDAFPRRAGDKIPLKPK